MGNYLFVFIGLVIISCESKNSTEKIDHIIKQDSYKVEIQYQGCFGGGTEVLEVKKNNNSNVAEYTYLDYSKQDGPHKKKRQISWTPEKEKILKDLFELGITLNESVNFCTTTSIYELSDFPYAVRFQDLNCTVTEEFEKIFE